jgi:hypothetical protein
METPTVRPGFFNSKAWKNQQIIKSFLEEPKTFPELCELLKKERKICKSKSSVSYALREVIRRGEVVGEINAESLKQTKGKIIPIYRRTRKLTIFHGGEPEDHRSDGREIMRCYIDQRGNLVGKQFFKKIKRKSRGYTYRRTSPILPL